MDKLRIFVSVVTNPIWKWFAGGLMTIIGLIDFFTPDKMTWLTVIKVVPWFWWVITGVVIWALATAWEASNRKFPNLRLVEEYVDLRGVTIPQKNQLYSGQTGTNYEIMLSRKLPDSVKRLGEYYFAHLVLVNKPGYADAEGCVAEIEFFDKSINKLPIGYFLGRWGDKDQPSQREYVPRPIKDFYFNIPSDGKRYELDFVTKDKRDNFCFAFNDNSYDDLELKTLPYKIVEDVFMVHVILRGKSFSYPRNFWLEITNEGRGRGMKVRKIRTPKIPKCRLSAPPDGLTGRPKQGGE